MNYIALTPEYLEHLLALGKAVPAGPWGTKLNAFELFDRPITAWGEVYANVTMENGHALKGCVIVHANTNLVSEEEKLVAREAYLKGEKVDPGLSGKLAAYIAAYHPAVTTALIMEILRLRGEVERLDREADWLANQIRDCPDEVDQEAYWDICKREDCRGFGKEDVAACWRRASHGAVEKGK